MTELRYPKLLRIRFTLLRRRRCRRLRRSTQLWAGRCLNGLSSWRLGLSCGDSLFERRLRQRVSQAEYSDLAKSEGQEELVIMIEGMGESGGSRTALPPPVSHTFVSWLQPNDYCFDSTRWNSTNTSQAYHRRTTWRDKSVWPTHDTQ